MALTEAQMRREALLRDVAVQPRLLVRLHYQIRQSGALRDRGAVLGPVSDLVHIDITGRLFLFDSYLVVPDGMRRRISPTWNEKTAAYSDWLNEKLTQIGYLAPAAAKMVSSNDSYSSNDFGVNLI